MKKILIFLLCFSYGLSAQDIQSKTRLDAIGFGSCNRTDLDPKIWEAIAQKQMQAWVWLGDIVYTDEESMQDLEEKYTLQKSLPAYQQLREQAAIFGVWDDHDYGTNDGGVAFDKKEQSRELLFDFLDLPETHPARKRTGAYQSYCFGEKEEKVCLYLLDVRYFKEPYVVDPSPNQRYKKNSGSLLGEEQWEWLENELQNDDAVVSLFAGGVQLLSSEHAYEKWSNFPEAQQRFFDLLIKNKIRNPIYLSGDRHIAEVSSRQISPNYWLYDATSSGLTHSYEGLEEEYNPYRIGPLMTHLNFGMIQWDWENRIVAIQILDDKGAVRFQQNIPIQ
ncbi:MAG: alkaline phosphatase D family protein [Flavobacteriaceae bacterium]|jgi:alkaline phosphatase D